MIAETREAPSKNLTRQEKDELLDSLISDDRSGKDCAKRWEEFYAMVNAEYTDEVNRQTLRVNAEFPIHEG